MYSSRINSRNIKIENKAIHACIKFERLRLKIKY